MNIPQIAITVDSVDNTQTNNISEALTDVEDLEEEVKQAKKYSKLKIKLNTDIDGAVTDCEDLDGSGSDNETSANIKTVAIQNDYYENTNCNETISNNSGPRGTLQSQLSSFKNNLEVQTIKDDALTDIEAFDTDENESDSEVKLPDIEIGLDEFQPQFVKDSSDYKPVENRCLSKSSSSHLNLSESPALILTDYELLDSDEENDEVYTQKIRLRRRKPKNSNKHNEFLKPEACKKNKRCSKLKKSNSQPLTNKLTGFESDGENEAKFDLKFPVCQKMVKNKKIILTDTEDLVLDETFLTSRPQIKRSSSDGIGNAEPHEILSLKEALESLNSTDNESFEGDFERKKYPDLELPSSNCTLVLLHENKSIIPTTKILPLDKIPTGLKIEDEEDDGLTDIENFNDNEFLDIDEDYNRAPTPNLIGYEGSVISYEDNRANELNPDDIQQKSRHKKSKKSKKMYLKIVPNVELPTTDTEDVYLSDRKSQTNDYYLLETNYCQDGTDIEEFDTDDEAFVENHEKTFPIFLNSFNATFTVDNDSKTSKEPMLLDVNKSVLPHANLTDVEDVYESEHDETPMRSLTATPSEFENHLEMQESSDIRIESRKKIDYNSPNEIMYLKGGSFRQALTDVEDFSDENNVLVNVQNGSVSFEKNREWDVPKKSSPTEKPSSVTQDAGEQVASNYITYESVLLTPDCNLPSAASHPTSSYKEIDNLLDKMLVQVEMQEKLFSLDLDLVEPDDSFINTLELIPETNALIEIPIKKNNCFASYQEIQLDSKYPEQDKPIIEENQFDNDTHLSTVLVKNAKIASSESLNDNDFLNVNEEDQDYEPIEYNALTHAYKKLDLLPDTDIWFEGTYRNLSVVPEEDEDENTSLLSNFSENTSISSNKYLYYNMPLQQTENNNDSDSDESTDESDRDSLAPNKNENIVKAEIKLLVKTTEQGKEAIEIRSVREFLETPPNRSKENKKKTQLGEKLATFKNKISSIVDRSKRVHNISFSEDEFGTNLLPKKENKPSFTFQQLFVRTPEPIENSLQESKKFGSRSELILNSKDHFPLEFDPNTSIETSTANLHANVPFYPCYNQLENICYNYKKILSPHTNPFTETISNPFNESDQLPRAYCDWLEDFDGGLSTTTERLVASNEEKLLDKPLGQQPLTGLSDIDNNLVIDLVTSVNQTNAFIQSESQPEPYDALAEKYSNKQSTSIDRKNDDNKNNINEKKKAKKGFFGSIKTFVKESFESDSDSEKSPKKSKKQKKEKKCKVKEQDLSGSSMQKPKLPTPPLEPHDLEDIPFVEASLSDLPPPYKPPPVPLGKETVPVTDMDFGIENKLNMTQKQETLSLPKKKIKSKTVHIEEVTKTIEPFVLEAEEFSVVVDPTKQESPKKSKETFTINIDESIEKIEKEILEKSPILSAEKIRKPLADLDLSGDIPALKPRIDAENKDDVQPVVSQPPDNVVNMPEKFERQDRRVSYKEELEEIGTNVQEEIEIIEKQDRELSKEKKSAFFGLFKKRDSRDEKKIVLSKKTLQEINETQGFLKNEICNYNDIKPVISKEDKNEQELEDKNVRDSDEATKNQSGSFFGLFKKTKKEEEEVNKNEESKETIVAQEEIKENEEETKQSSSGLFGIFKKSKKDETELTQVVLSKQVLKDMDSSKKFLQDEVANYEDVKLTAEVKETKVFETEEDNENKIDVKVADKIQEPDEETSGFFGFFKKSKKEDKPKMQAEKLGADTVEELKQVEVCFEVETKVDKKEEQPSKEFQVTELKDEKVKIEEKSKLEKELKSISRESSPKPSGFFGLFKKPKKDESSDANEKSIIPEAALRDISDTNKFIMSEITNYNDVKPIKFDIIAEPKDETIDLTTKPTSLKNIEKIPSETTAITKKTVNPLVEEIKENVSTEEVVRRSPKSSRGLFNIFRKSKDGCLEISEEVLKNINETRQFLISEKENYDDVKPPKFEAIIYEETNNAKIIDSAQESSPKPTKGFLSSIFKKSKDDSQDIQQTESIENEKKTDVSKEIVNEKNLKAVTEISVEKQSSTDASPKTSRGLFSRLKKSKDESIEGSILKTSDKAVLTIKESDEFLKNEIINYQDVKPKKFETVIETTVEPTKSTLEGTPKHSKKLFGFLKKSKDDSVESKIVLSETALKDMACTSDFLEKELQYFDDMKPAKFATISDEKQEKVKNEAKEIESSEKLSKSIFKLFKKSKTSEDEEVNSKPLLSETVLKEMHDSNEFLNTEKEKYYDVMPKIIVTEHQQPKESTGFLSRFKKSKKEEDIVVLVDVSQNEEEKIAEKVEASLEEEPKTGFLAKFKITKKRPTSQEDQVSEETLKNMVDAGEFLNNEKDNYEDVLMETKEIKIINEASPLAVEKLPKANEIPVKTSDVLETVETVTTLIENTKSSVVIEEETDKIKDNFDQNNKKSKKEKKGIFNIFGKKSKSQEASESKKEDSDTLKQRKSSSPFKFFEKSKNSEDDSVIEKVLIEKTEQQTSEMEIKDDILTIELNEQLSLTDEVLASLDKKISNIRQNYSKESVKHMHDCRDFLFIEMDNYDNGKDLVVTDIDKDSEDLSKEAASKAIDDIISLATTTIVMQQSEELQKSESKQEITKTDLTSTEEQVVKDGQEKFTKNESPKPKKQGFLSKLGNFITGTTEDISSEAKKNRQIAEEKLSNVDINVSTKILETSEFPKDKSNILTENLKTIKDSMVDNTQQTFESTNKDIGEIKTSIKQETDSFKLKQKDCANTVKAKVITTIDDVNKTSEQVADNIAKAQESVVFQTTKLVDTAIDNANESIKREAENEFNKLPSSAKHVTDEIKSLIAENSINFEDKILTTTTKIKEDTCKSIETCKESSDSKIEQGELKTKSFVQDKCNTLESIKKQYKDQIEKTRANIEENTLKVISDAAIIKKELIDGSEAKLNELKQSSDEKINNLKETKETLTKQVTKEINETKISINEKVEDDITKVKKVLADDGKEIKNKIVTETSKKTEDIKEKTQKMQESLKQNISNQIEDSEKSLIETIDNLCPIKDSIDQNITSQTSHIQHIIKSENDHTKTIKNNLEEDPTHQLQDNQSLVNQSTESVSQYVTEDLNSPKNLSKTADFTTQLIDGKINNNLKYKEQKLEQLESAKESLVQEINHKKQQKHKILEQAYDNIQQTTKSIETKVDKAQKQQENVFEKVTSNVKEVKNLVSGTVTSGSKLSRETLEESINKTDKSVNVAASKLQHFQNSTETNLQKKIDDTDKQLDRAANMAVSTLENIEQNVSENIDKIQSNTQKKLKEAYDSTSTIVNEQTVKLQEIDEELTKLTMSMGPIVGEQSKKRKQETKEATGIITSPTSRVASQKYSTENRPSVVEITRMKSEDEDDKIVNLHYTVTEPDDENDSKRKPLFHLESEDDDSFETSFKPRERSDSVKSNVLETLSENKLDHVLSKLEEDVVKNLQQTVTGTKEETIEVEGEAVKKAEATLETLKKDSQADVDQIEQKLRDLDKALETLEHASDPKLERKLHRVERKFERMASEVIDSNIDVDASPTEVETRGEHEFQRLVSQLSTEEVSDFQKEYSHLWDETTFSKSDEWDSKTPDSQVDVQELPQEIATSTPTLTEDTKQIPQPKPRFAKDPPLQLNKSQDEQQPPKQDKQISPVRDDLLDDDEVVLETYSDKKKFWENVTSKESIAPKRLSLSEISVAENELIKKRMSVHEIGVFPKPKPRTVQVSQSIDESNLQSEIVKELTQELSKIKAEKILPPLSQKGEEEEEETDHRIMTEYQASFLPPSEMKRKSPPKVESDKESSDSESDNQLISGGNENTGYISDSGDVEHYISDSEIEDRVPQIRERQMSVFAPPVAAVRKNIYERSSSLPTEDLYEVSARSAKLRKQYYEEQIKKEMIEEQLTSEIEEEPSPERKTIFGTLIEQSSEDKTTSSVQDLVHAFDKNIRHSIDEVHDIENFMEIIEKKEVSFDPLHKPVLKTKDESQGSISSTQIIETHKEIDFETQNNRFSVGSEHSSSSKETKDESISKPDSMEVHVDKSEIEDSEKLAELDQDGTDMETKSIDSFNATEMSPKSSFLVDEPIPEITVTLSGKQRRISEESDEYAPKIDKTDKPDIESPIRVPEEHVEDTVWEVSVQSQPEARFNEKAILFDSVTVEKIDEDLSISTKDESDLGSEIHQDHSDSNASDKIKSESHSDIERIILDSLHHQKVDPVEAKAIASALIGEIETEIERRECLPPASETYDISEYLKYLAETKGLDEREVELVESVLARRQRELSKLSRGDTQASSIEITDEDLRYSGTDFEASHILEQQISQLKAEKIDEMKTLSFLDKIDEKLVEETHTSKDYKSYDNGVASAHKTEMRTKTSEGIKSEKSETKDTIFEEDETISESTTHEFEQKDSQIEATATEVIESQTHDAIIKEVHQSTVDIKKEELIDSVAKSTTIENDDKTVAKEEFKTEENRKIEANIKHEFELTETRDDYQVNLKGELRTDDFLKEEKMSKLEKCKETKDLKDGGKFEKESAIKESINKVVYSEIVGKKIEETQALKDEDCRITQSQTHSTTILMDVQRQSATSKETTETLETLELDPALADTLGEIKTIVTHQEIKRTSSSDSKSSADSGKTPDDQFSTCSSGRKGDSETSKQIEKPEVQLRKNLGLHKPDRKSGIEFEAYSSSGESHYHSFELDSGKSRPCSSDIEGIVAAGSSEYESALTSQDYSSRSHLTSTEYHTAVSSLSSKESMKSLDSESSGHLGSIEISELSETLVPSASDLEGDDLDGAEQQLLDEESWTPDQVDDDLNDIQSKMKRSHEMTFQPEPKILTESPHSEDVDKKLFTSMDETSVVSMSLSSTSATEPQTVIELSRTDSEKGGSMTVSGTSGQLSIEGSCDSLVFHPTITASTTDISTSTGNTDANLQIESITFTTSVVNESGIRSVSTQVTSETNASEIEKVEENITLNGTSYVEMKKKGHRRQESTSFVPPILTGIKAEIEPKIHSDLAESDKYTAELSLKEVISDEKKDVDEKEKDESCETEADQGFQQDVREGKYKDDQEDEIKDDTPEFSSETQTSVGELEQEYKSALARSQETKKKIESASELHFQKEPLEKKDSHGKSSSTSSEKSSFEEAEAEAAFNMVAHISPAHKIKQICPILEDEDAEKHELETRERAQKEFEKKRAQMRDQSPGSIPDIKVTEHMTPLIDQGFHYPEVDIAEHERKQEEAQKSVPQTPSSKSSEDTDQGREYVLEDSGISIPEESGTESKSTVVEQAIKEDLDKDTESPNSDSFEMLEKPDLIDDFVVIEEVAKEAHECDSEGKSVSIHLQKVVKKKKHDEEVEAYLAHSAPTPLTKMTDVKFYPDGSSSDELGFEFEDSPPINNAGTATSYDQELEANKKWIEQQFQGDQAARMAAGYDYEMDFERGPLEDIKEEDINDFDGSSRIGSLGSQKESGGSLGGSIKDSYSSTPEYDVLAGRKYFTRSGDHDDVSMSSLQEFESLERAMSLEQRKFHQGSQDSSSNGSFKTRYNASKSGQGDDVSVSSLKEFEGLEMACIAAHKVEIKVKEEEAILAQIEEGQESLASESESLETISRTDKKTVPESDEEDYEKRMFEIDEIIRQAQTNVERFIDLKEGEKTESLGRGDSIEEVSRVPDLELDAPVVRSTVKVQWKENDAMITSTDSIEAKVTKGGSQHDSTDSLDQKTGADIMTASTDSIEVQSKKTEPINLLSDSIEIKDEGACGMISSDSLELAIHQKQPDEMIESTDSLMDVTSSTATHATYQYETDSVFSGSFTSGGSNTMVSSTDTIEPHHVDIGAAARKVWFDAEAGTSGFSTEYMQDTGKPYVTEVIEPCEGDEFSHTIHRRVEMPPEVRKITFYGSDADVRLKQFIDDFNEGEHVEEIEEVDEAGNIHTKRVVQKRVVIKCSDDNEATTGEKDQLLKKSLASKTNQLITKEAKAEDAGAASSSAGGIESSSIKAQAGHRRQLRYDISVDDQIEVDPREHDWRFNLPEHVEKDEQKFDLVGQPSTHQGSISDQHQLSDEMKELLKELEKESKQ